MGLFVKKNEQLIKQFEAVLENKILDAKEFDKQLMDLSYLIQEDVRISTNRKLNLYDNISKARNALSKDRKRYLKKIKRLL